MKVCVVAEYYPRAADPARAAAPDEPLAFARLPFDHPLYILYSSGTTGLPKPIVHGHGGILLEHAKALALHKDIGPDDRGRGPTGGEGAIEDGGATGPSRLRPDERHRAPGLARGGGATGSAAAHSERRFSAQMPADLRRWATSQGGVGER